METGYDRQELWESTHGGAPIKCMLDVGKTLKRLMEQRLSETEMTPIQTRILGYISMEERKGSCVFQRDIEEMFRIRRSSVTSVLQLLEKKGLLRRESVPEDARLKKLVLTEKGCKQQEWCIHQVSTMEKEVREIFTEEELRTFFSYMSRIDKRIFQLYCSKEETDD